MKMSKKIMLHNLHACNNEKIHYILNKFQVYIERCAAKRRIILLNIFLSQSNTRRLTRLRAWNCRIH